MIAALRARLRPLVAHGGLPLVWLMLTVVALVPLWSQRLLPMLELPRQLALARAVHDIGHSDSRISEFFLLRARPLPGILYYWLMRPLQALAPVEVAHKLILSAYLIAWPLSLLALARALGRSPWLALGGFVLAFNQSWMYGFAPQLLASCLVGLGWAAELRWLDGGQRRHLWLLGACALVAWLGHALPWLLLVAGALGLAAATRTRAAGWSLVALAPSLGLAALTLAAEQRAGVVLEPRGAHVDWLSATWHDFPTLVRGLPRAVLELFPGRLDSALLWTATATVAALCLWLGTRGRGGTRLRVLLGVTVAAYLLLPYDVARPLSVWHLAPRVAPFVAALALLLPAGRLDGRRRLACLPLVLVALVLPLALAVRYRDYSRRMMPLVRLAERVPRGATCLVIVRDVHRGIEDDWVRYDPAVSGPVDWNASAWPMALGAGYAPYLPRGLPLVPRRTLAAPDWTRADVALREAPEFEYYLVRGVYDPFAVEPALHAVEQLADWTLYRRIANLSDEP